MASSIGILGGTFDPIHFGHLRPALEVLEALSLSQIRFIPNGVPPHKPQPIASIEQRLTMLQFAVDKQLQFELDLREIHRQGTSYTIDTLHSLRQDFPNSALYLMMGTDAFLGIQTWHRWQEILEFAHIVVMQRPGEVAEMNATIQQWFENHIAQTGDSTLLHGKIWPVAVSQLMISSTDIRKHVVEGQSLQFLLPEQVAEFIEQTRLYKGME